jgi:isopenicillin N synthase-like dioxygenase
MQPSALYKKIRHQILSQHYAALRFPLSAEQLTQAANAFINFLKLPQATKNSFDSFVVHTSNPGSRVGYTLRRQEQGALDEKEYFHYNEYAGPHFATQLSKTPQAQDFFDQAQHVYDAAKRTLSDVMHAFDTEFPGIYDTFFPSDRKPDFFLRFLKYNVMGPGNFLAKGHYDRGGCTLALAESAPGLRMGTNSSDLKDVVHQPGSALFFPAIKFQEVTSQEFVPTWHEVVQKGDDVFSREVARWAIVFFADPRGMEDIPFDLTHTPQAERKG